MMSVLPQPHKTIHSQTPHSQTTYTQTVHTPELPDKYYLQHFNELLQQIERQSPLLSSIHLKWIQAYRQLSEDCQCLLIRCMNRKNIFIHRSQYQYREINNIDICFQTLTTAGFFRPLLQQDSDLLIKTLNKNELIAIAKYSSTKRPPLSAPKPVWQQWCLKHILFSAIQHDEVITHRLILTSKQIIEYFQFLFFGQITPLHLFSLRDLGIMKTKSHATIAGLRFHNRDIAEYCFRYHRALNQLDQLDADALAVVGRQLLQEKHHFPVFEAEEAFAKYAYHLGIHLLKYHPKLGQQVLKESRHPKAIEKVIRLAYADQKKDWAKKQLIHIIEEHSCESLIVFAEDFLAQKFNNQKISKMTAFQRDGLPSIALEEAFIGQAEKGIKLHHNRHQRQAYQTENRLWRALFGLTFWPLLFELNPLCSEFDHTPPVLAQNQFYFRSKKQIDQLMHRLSQPDALLKHLTTTATTQYGRANGLFRWHPRLLEILQVLIKHCTLSSIQRQLVSMARNYQGLKDGYPDLMICDGRSLWFEEIKAPGDKLRRNQLVTITQLQKNGFDVRLQPTHWAPHPRQPYVIVDVETTGGKSPAHRITEIAMIKMVNHTIVDQFTTLINPERAIPKGITQLTGITQEMVAEAPLFYQVADKISHFMQDSIFVAHNVNFDYGFIQREFERVQQRFVHPKLCTVRLARKHLTGLTSFSLQAICQQFDIPLHHHHRAYDDAFAASEILKLINQKRDAPISC